MRSSSSILVIVALVHLTACGGPEPVEENIATPVEVEEAPASEPQQPQIPGFGPVTIRMRGTEPVPGANFIGDCDGKPLDDDLEVMSFYAPWKIVARSGGSWGGYGSPFGSSFVFEKSPDASGVKLELDFGLERRDLTAADLTAGYRKVADLTFSPGSVGLHRAIKPVGFMKPYVAVFPLVAHEGMPQEREFTNRYIATVELISTSLPEFDGWSEGEIIQLFDSFYTERCLGEGLKQGWAALTPTLIFE